MADDRLPQTASFVAPKDASLQRRLGAARDASMERSLADLIRTVEQARRPRSLAVIDLAGAGPPRSAGWHAQDERYVASMAKMPLGVAAFQLREDIRASADLTGPRTRAEAWRGLLSHWTASPSPLVSRLGRLKASQLPDYQRILDPRFDETGLPADLELEAGTRRRLAGDYTEEYIDRLDELDDQLDAKGTTNTERYELLGALPFHDVLHLALRWSNNWAATACVTTLGVPYLMTCMAQLGLFDPRSRTGLHLGGWYAAPDKRARRLISPVSVPVVPQPPRGNEMGASTQAGSSASFALLFACLSQGLVVPGSVHLLRPMLDHLRVSVRMKRMFAGDITPAPTEHIAKVGIHKPGKVTAATPQIWSDSVSLSADPPTPGGTGGFAFSCSATGFTTEDDMHAFGERLLKWVKVETAFAHAP